MTDGKDVGNTPVAVRSFDYAKHFGTIRTFGELTRDPSERSWVTSLPREPEHHDFVVWLGCNILRTAHIADTLSDVLRYLEIDFVALGGPSHCCGVVHEREGDAAVGSNMLQRTMTKFDAYTPAQMLNWCPSCDGQLRKLSSDAITETAAARVTVTCHIGRHIDRLAFTRTVPLRVALHTHTGSPDEDADAAVVRAILASIPGLELVDVPEVTAYGRHCADANILKHGLPAYRSSVAEWVAAARDRGATHLVSIYHSCHRHLILHRPAGAEQPMEVVNYLTLMARALGLPERDDRFAQFAASTDLAETVEALGPLLERLKIEPARARAAFTDQFGT